MYMYAHVWCNSILYAEWMEVHVSMYEGNVLSQCLCVYTRTKCTCMCVRVCVFVSSCMYVCAFV